MLTYGFFNSVGGDRKYSAEDMSAIFDGIINDGIFASVGDHFQVKPTGTLHTIKVGTGRAWLNSTWTLNDSEYPLTIPSTSSSSYKRIDMVYIMVNHSDSIRRNYIGTIQGGQSASPNKPKTPADNVEAGIYYHPIAYVTVGYNTVITDSDIENVIGMSGGTPYVNGILTTTAVDELWQQWDGEFRTWWENVKKTLDTDTVTRLQNEIDHLKPQTSTITKYFSSVADAGDYPTDAILNKIAAMFNGDLKTAGTQQTAVQMVNDLRLKGSGNYGSTLYFGDGSYAYIKEPTDDNMEIKANTINLNATTALQVGGTEITAYLKNKTDTHLWIRHKMKYAGFNTTMSPTSSDTQYLSTSSSGYVWYITGTSITVDPYTGLVTFGGTVNTFYVTSNNYPTVTQLRTKYWAEMSTTSSQTTSPWVNNTNLIRYSRSTAAASASPYYCSACNVYYTGAGGTISNRSISYSVVVLYQNGGTYGSEQGLFNRTGPTAVTPVSYEVVESTAKETYAEGANTDGYFYRYVGLKSDCPMHPDGYYKRQIITVSANTTAYTYSTLTFNFAPRYIRLVGTKLANSTSTYYSWNGDRYPDVLTIPSGLRTAYSTLPNMFWVDWCNYPEISTTYGVLINRGNPDGASPVNGFSGLGTGGSPMYALNRLSTGKSFGILVQTYSGSQYTNAMTSGYTYCFEGLL